MEEKLAKGERVVMMRVVDALDRKSSQEVKYIEVVKPGSCAECEEKKEHETRPVILTGAVNGTNAREVICAVRRQNILCTAFHPELTYDYRWHEYFVNMVREATKA